MLVWKFIVKTKEKAIQIYQRGMPIKTAGRMRGNMEVFRR